MTAPPLTRASLLVRLRDPNDTDAWTDFVRLYASVIYGFARKRGLQDADAADLMQEVLRSVAGAVGEWQYDPRKGTFRGWLYSVTRNKVYNFLESRRRHPRGTGDSNAHQRLEEHPGREAEADDWDREYERRAFAWASDRVRPEFQPNTWQAFWLTAVEGENAKDAGRRLGLSPGAVYVAKSRVLARLKEEISQLSDP
jgi:RNA polymerase sigma-70 factor (ECF subfamily)